MSGAETKESTKKVVNNSSPGRLPNARLIARAPELLVLLQELREALQDIVGSPAVFDDSRIDYVNLQVARADLAMAHAVIRRARALHARIKGGTR